jgi:hypothetical protein
MIYATIFNNHSHDHVDLRARSSFYARDQIYFTAQSLDNFRQVESMASADEGDNLGSTAHAVNTADVTMSTIKVASLPRDLIRPDGDSLGITIENFLAKPEILATGAFQSSDTPTTFANYRCDIGLNTTLKANKISSALCVRFDTVVTLQVNANRFQQGRYILAFLATGGVRETSGAETTWLASHRFSIQQVTQLPHVEIDLNVDTQVQLKIPYVSFTNGLINNSNASASTIGNPGFFFLYPYSPFSAASGSTLAEWTIWLHYENVELWGNTNLQSYQAQSRGTSRKGKDLLQQEMAKTGPIEGGLRLASSVSSAIATIPSLSSVAGPVSWAADFLANAASSFGWSKPSIVQEPTRIFEQKHPHFANVDSHAITQPLSLRVQNHVSVLPGAGGTDMDEMTIDYLKSIRTAFSTVNFTTAQAEAANLFTYDMTPNNFYKAYTDGTQQVNCLSTVNFISNFFDYWRGGFTVVLKIVKTEFHSGRLLFMYTPYDAAYLTPTPAFNDNAYLHKQILDIREGSEFVITVPYISVRPWLSITGDSSSVGKISLWVLDALVAPATVGSTVPILVEIAGAADMEFAVPRANMMTTQIPYSSQCYQAQVQIVSDAPIGGTSIASKSIVNDETCIGEKVASFRDLVKRGNFMHGDAYISSVHAVISPRMAYRAIGSATTTTFQGGYSANGMAGADIISILTQLYALTRGGTRLNVIPDTQNSNSMFTAALRKRTWNTNYTTFATSTAQTNQEYYFDNNNCVHAVDPYSNCNLAVSVPQYSQFHSLPCAAQGAELIENYGKDQLLVNIRNSGTTISYYNLWRSGADDHQFMCFVSIPPCINITRP